MIDCLKEINALEENSSIVREPATNIAASQKWTSAKSHLVSKSMGISMISAKVQK